MLKGDGLVVDGEAPAGGDGADGTEPAPTPSAGDPPRGGDEETEDADEA